MFWGLNLPAGPKDTKNEAVVFLGSKNHQRQLVRNIHFIMHKLQLLKAKKKEAGGVFQ